MTPATETSPGAASVRADGLGFRYAGASRDALSDLSFDVEPGQCLLLLGPSGSGKSTLALAIAGLVPRDVPGTWRGQLTVGGVDVSSAPRGEAARRVGIVFQDPQRQIVMDRVEDDVAFGLENQGWPVPDMRNRVPEALAEVGLGGSGRAGTQALSGGQQQRLALAGVLAPGPRVLVLDEPTANLDPGGAEAFVARLAHLRERRSTTIVLIEHRVDLVWELADRLFVLDGDGQPVAFGTPSEVVARAGPRLVAIGVWLPQNVERELGTAGPSAPESKSTGALQSPRTPEAVVEAAEVSFAYEEERSVVRDVSLAVQNGERIALVGPNGSGKSTLARLLVGLLRPTRGRVALAGAEPHRLAAPVLARRAGYVFQDPEQQFLTTRVQDEVRLGLRDAELAAVQPLMEAMRLPLEEFGDRSPYTLSGGEQRRLSLATALARTPELLVLDEPTFGQDRHGYDGLLEILGRRVDSGAAVIAATHDRRFAADFARRTIEMRDGRIVSDTGA